MAGEANSIEVSTDEARRFEEHVQQLITERLRLGLVAAFLLVVAFACFAPASYPALPARRLLEPLAWGGLALIVAEALSFVPYVARHPNTVVLPLGVALAWQSGVLASMTGGVSSPFFYVVFIIWIFGSAILPLPATVFAMDSAAQVAAAMTAILVNGEPGPIAMPALLSVGGLAYCVLGAVLRDRAGLRAWAVKARLDTANRELAEGRERLARLNGELERRVEQAVSEIVRHARDVEALNAQLQLKVQARALELGRALNQTAPPDEIVEGRVFEGRVTVVRMIGKGGMGEVYEGVDLVTNDRCALKVLRGTPSKQAIELFLSEASAAAKISHPGIVRARHVDVSSDGRLFQILDLVIGRPLDAYLETEVFEPGAAASIGAALADALAAAHDAGVIHRDVKPSNIVLTKTPPGVCIVDFGVSKLTSEVERARQRGMQLLGSPLYISPEQIRAPADVTPATDIYALGLVIYRMIVGRHPFKATDLAGIVMAHFVETPRPLAEIADVAAELSDVVARCLSKTPEARPTARELATELHGIAQRLGHPDAWKIEGATQPLPTVDPPSLLLTPSNESEATRAD